ncbi:MAG TPA: hypothetical protein VMZ50_12875 [Phycisphaerae bacterium]|nr:hypothetical protein [Phycisphaerae bacterium]
MGLDSAKRHRRRREGEERGLYAVAVARWGAEPPGELAQAAGPRPCALCEVDFSTEYQWPVGLRRCACGEWHFACQVCVDRFTLLGRPSRPDAPAGPGWEDRYFGPLEVCPEGLTVARELMGLPAPPKRDRASREARAAARRAQEARRSLEALLGTPSGQRALAPGFAPPTAPGRP